ncbi:adenosylcobinamide-phosphate synthase CbiB [Roseivivax sp. CAU 1761]
MSFAGAMLAALLIDAAIGWPDRVYARIGHPVTWLGRLIAALDARLNREGDAAARRRAAGRAAVALTLAAAILPAWLIQAALPGGWPGLVLTGALAWPLVAARALDTHVAAVARPLARGDLAAARCAVAMIVGRDPARLDAAGVSRAALESLAENASDGVVAPLFWGAVFGLPGIAGYKAVNTLDSMIGHRSARHLDFGRAAARLDDLANWLPARLTGLALVLVAPAPRRAWRVMRRDARAHRSPNAGWPEAAMAGALGCRLSGPRIYPEGVAREPWLHPEGRDPGPAELNSGLVLYRRALLALGLALAALALA